MPRTPKDFHTPFPYEPEDHSDFYDRGEHETEVSEALEAVLTELTPEMRDLSEALKAATEPFMPPIATGAGSIGEALSKGTGAKTEQYRVSANELILALKKGTPERDALIRLLSATDPNATVIVAEVETAPDLATKASLSPLLTTRRHLVEKDTEDSEGESTEPSPEKKSELVKAAERSIKAIKIEGEEEPMFRASLHGGSKGSALEFHPIGIALGELPDRIRSRVVSVARGEGIPVPNVRYMLHDIERGFSRETAIAKLSSLYGGGMDHYARALPAPLPHLCHSSAVVFAFDSHRKIQRDEIIQEYIEKLREAGWVIQDMAAPESVEESETEAEEAPLSIDKLRSAESRRGGSSEWSR